MIKNQNLNIPYSPYTDTLEVHMRLVVEHIRQMAPGKKLQIAILNSFKFIYWNTSFITHLFKCKT